RATMPARSTAARSTHPTPHSSPPPKRRRTRTPRASPPPATGRSPRRLPARVRSTTPRTTTSNTSARTRAATAASAAPACRARSASPRRRPGSLALECLLQRGEIELLHLEHRLRGALGLLAVLAGDHLVQRARHDLPRHAVLVLHPAALLLAAAVAQERVVVAIDLLLILADHHERDRVIE